MLGKNRVICSLLIVLGIAATLSAADVAPGADEIRTAVVKALPLLEKGAAGSMAERPQCFTCHNQGLPLLALTTARASGFKIDGEHVETQAQFIADFLTNNREKLLADKGTGGEVATAGQALWALETTQWKPDAATTAVGRVSAAVRERRPPVAHDQRSAPYGKQPFHRQLSGGSGAAAVGPRRIEVASRLPRRP